MIKALLLALFCCGCHASETNILVYVRMQWSTNGTNWNEDWQTNGIDDVDVFPVNDGTNHFFRSQITNYFGELGDWEVVGVDNWCGPTVKSITNHLSTSTFYVSPNLSVNSNIIYRPILSITNYP